MAWGIKLFDEDTLTDFEGNELPPMENEYNQDEIDQATIDMLNNTRFDVYDSVSEALRGRWDDVGS